MSILSRNRVVNKVVEIPVENIEENPYQPRKVFNKEQLETLSKSISSQGLLQPIVVRKMGENKYQLVSGERRLLATKLNETKYIKCIVEEMNNSRSAVLALIENMQRENLNFFEEALGIQKLIQEFGYKQEQISHIISKNQSTISNKIRLLKYNQDIQNLILENNLTERHARALLKIDNQQQLIEVIQHISKHGYNVSQTEKYIDTLINKKPKSKGKTIFIVKDLRIFVNSINKTIDIMKQSGIYADSQIKEDEEYVTYTIKIPKQSIYKKSKQNQKKSDEIPVVNRMTVKV